MLPRLSIKFVLICLFAALSTASAATVDFQGTGATHGNLIPNGYDGFNWSYVVAIDLVNYPQPSYSGYDDMQAVTHDPYMAVVPAGYTGAFSRLTPFILNGLYLDASWNDSLPLQIAGFLGNIQVYASSVTVNTTSPLYLAPNVAVDRFQITATGIGIPQNPYYQAAHTVIGRIDYAEISDPTLDKVHTPEPGTLFSAGAAALLIGIGSIRRRRNN